MTIIYIDRRQYICTGAAEIRVAQLIQGERASLLATWREGSSDRFEVRHSLRQLRRLRTDFFEARMLSLASACVRQVHGMVHTAQFGWV